MISNSFILSNLAFMVDDENDLAKLSIGNFYDSLGNYNDALTFYLKIEDNSAGSILPSHAIITRSNFLKFQNFTAISLQFSKITFC